jgi:serine/threonine-protein kinase
VTTVGAFLGTFLVGYLVAALVLFPAPIFATTRTIPRVLGLVRSEAETRLTEGGLRIADIEGVTHPTAARGQVVWQDPPAGVGVPEGTLIRLTVSNGPQRVPVPDLLGYHATVARQLLEAAGLEVGRLIQTQAPVPQGVVVSTRPSTGSPILPGSAVTLVVSVGAPTITVPDLTGLTQEEADLILQQVGLTLGTTLRQASRDVPPGTIVEQAPGVGTLSAPGTAVNIFIARAPSR